MTSNSTRDQQYKQVLKNFSDFYTSESKKLYNLLRDKGVSINEIADALGVVRTAVVNRFETPRKKDHENV